MSNQDKCLCTKEYIVGNCPIHGVNGFYSTPLSIEKNGYKHTPPKVDSWEEEFDMQFRWETQSTYDTETIKTEMVEIKDFIRSLLASREAHLVAELEKAKKDVRPERDVWLSGNRETNEAYNLALSHAISIVKGEK